MIILRLVNIRCWKDRTFTFPTTGLVLLHGMHGSGKTTIIKGFMFALFGSEKILPHSIGTKEDSFVELTIPGYFIRRTKRPSETLLVKREGVGVFEGESAQAEIERLLQSEEMCRACSVLTQLRRKMSPKDALLLLTGTGAQKFNIITTLTFQTPMELERFEEDLQKHDSQIKMIGEEITKFTRDLENLQKEVASLGECEPPLFSEAELVRKKEEALKVYQEITSLAERLPQIRHDAQERQRLTEEIKSLSKKLEGLQVSEVNEDALNERAVTLRMNILNYQKVSLAKQKVYELRERFKVSECPIEDPVLLREKWRKWTTRVTLEKEVVKVCRKEIPEEGWDTLRENLEESLRLKPLVEEIRCLEASISSLEKELETLVVEDVASLEKAVENLVLKSRVKKCPECSAHLYEDEHGLHPLKSRVATTPQEEAGLRRRLEAARKAVEKRRQVEVDLLVARRDMKAAVERTPSYATWRMPPARAEDLLRTLSALSPLKGVREPGVTVERVEAFLKVRQELREAECLLESLQYEEIDALQAEAELAQIIQRLKEHREAITTLQVTQKQLQLAKGQLDKLPPDTLCETVDRLESLKTEYREMAATLKDNATRLAHHSRLIALREEIANLEGVIREKSLDVAAITSLRQDRVEVFYRSLEEMVDKINKKMRKTLNVFFPEGIEVELSLFTETKTGKIKPEVDLKINYKGAEYKSISDLSGGEDSLVTLALTSALSKFTACPFLLCDEAIGTIQEHYKETVFNYFQEKIATKKLVIFIEHAAIEGHFDEVVSL